MLDSVGLAARGARHRRGPRAWDMAARTGTWVLDGTRRVGVPRLSNVVRRIRLKASADAAPGPALRPAAKANRRAVELAIPMLKTAFSDGPQALAALRRGEDPGANVLLMVDWHRDSSAGSTSVMPQHGATVGARRRSTIPTGIGRSPVIAYPDIPGPSEPRPTVAPWRWGIPPSADARPATEGARPASRATPGDPGSQAAPPDGTGDRRGVALPRMCHAPVVQLPGVSSCGATPGELPAPPRGTSLVTTGTPGPVQIAAVDDAPPTGTPRRIDVTHRNGTEKAGHNWSCWPPCRLRPLARVAPDQNASRVAAADSPIRPR
jgi:hypothetical protein